ncbi:MAG TPA: hypothetical protein VK844_06690 [Hyphomicrobiales bacterium]|nr:hypothetical protein [Hyphomicrobiales bacterium]
MTRKSQASRIDDLVPGDAAPDEATAEEKAAALCAPGDALSYIRGMAEALRDMAEDADQLLLAYLLDMAHEEARQQSRRIARGESETVGRA